MYVTVIDVRRVMRCDRQATSRLPYLRREDLGNACELACDMGCSMEFIRASNGDDNIPWSLAIPISYWRALCVVWGLQKVEEECILMAIICVCS